MVHGQANVGVASSTLHHQRVAVAAAYCGGGSGDLDVALMLAAGSKGQGGSSLCCPRVLPRHVGRGGLVLVAPETIPKQVGQRCLAQCCWEEISLGIGPAAAFVVSAERGWRIVSAFEAVTDSGVTVLFHRDPPPWRRERSASLSGDGGGWEQRRHPCSKAMVDMAATSDRSSDCSTPRATPSIGDPGSVEAYGRL